MLIDSICPECGDILTETYHGGEANTSAPGCRCGYVAWELLDEDGADDESGRAWTEALMHDIKSFSQAVAALAARGYTVGDKSGDGWPVTPPGGGAEERQWLTKAGVIALARDLASATETGALSIALQDCARRYVAARDRAGAALLDMAAELAQARDLARHGEWYTFLATVGTSEDQADRLLAIHDQAMRNPAFADAIRRNVLTLTTAALLATVRNAVLLGQLATAVRAALELADAAAGADLTTLADDLDDATYEALAAYRRARSGRANPGGA